MVSHGSHSLVSNFLSDLLRGFEDDTSYDQFKNEELSVEDVSVIAIGSSEYDNFLSSIKSGTWKVREDLTEYTFSQEYLPFKTNPFTINEVVQFVSIEDVPSHFLFNSQLNYFDPDDGLDTHDISWIGDTFIKEKITYSDFEISP